MEELKNEIEKSELDKDTQLALKLMWSIADNLNDAFHSIFLLLIISCVVVAALLINALFGNNNQAKSDSFCAASALQTADIHSLPVACQAIYANNK